MSALWKLVSGNSVLLYGIAALLALLTLSGGVNVVQYYQIETANANAAKQETVANQARANATANGKSAGEWQAISNTCTDKLNAKDETCNGLFAQNQKALTDAQTEKETAKEKLRRFEQKMKDAQKGTCGALLATPICAEALPDE